MWHSPIACCSSQKFGLTHYGQSSCLINKDIKVEKYSPASWSNIIELQDPATCQENVNYVKTSSAKKIGPPSCFFATPSHRRWHMSLSFFQQIQADDLSGNFWFLNLRLFSKIFVTWVPRGFGHERAPGNLIWNGYLNPILNKYCMVNSSSVVKSIYLTFLREKA